MQTDATDNVRQQLPILLDVRGRRHIFPRLTSTAWRCFSAVYRRLPPLWQKKTVKKSLRFFFLDGRGLLYTGQSCCKVHIFTWSYNSSPRSLILLNTSVQNCCDAPLIKENHEDHDLVERLRTKLTNSYLLFVAVVVIKKLVNHSASVRDLKAFRTVSWHSTWVL